MPPNADQILQPPEQSIEAPTAPPSLSAVPPQPLPPWKRLALGLLALLVALILWEVITSFVAYTGDAYVRSDLIAVAPQVTGQISQIAIVDNQPIHRGDLLAKIDPEPFQLAVSAAQETLQADMAIVMADADSVRTAQDDLQSGQAELTDAQEMQRRSTVLSHEGYASAQTLDTTTAVLTAAQAKTDASRAAIARAQAVLAAASAEVARDKAELGLATWRLNQTILRAPADGTINNLTLQIGDTAYANTPLIGIIAADDWRIIANYKQSYLASFHTGDTAWVFLDAHPWHVYRARIRGIGRGISRQPGDTGLLPHVAPTTDWIRLQHRFPVTLDLVSPPPDLTLFTGADARCIILP
jgi:membrane fusion protein, multidrug efflux system